MPVSLQLATLPWAVLPVVVVALAVWTGTRARPGPIRWLDAWLRGVAALVGVLVAVGAGDPAAVLTAAPAWFLAAGVLVVAPLVGLAVDLVLGSAPRPVPWSEVAAVAVAVESAAADADITAVESPWELAKLFARPHKAGVIVCGDGAARSEIEDVFRHRPAGWLRVHVRGDDQEPAAGADVAMAGDDLTGLLGAVAKHLLGGRS